VDPLTLRFQVVHREAEGAARLGRLETPHGIIETPAFLPVGTYGAVRGMAPEDLRTIGVEAILTNTYHLHLRPGEDAVARLGGLHGFMSWDRPIMTDSGGFQVFSLDRLCECTEEGVRFRSPLDGSRHFLSPEDCIRIQERLGADLIVTLDQFEPIGRGDPDVERKRVRELTERTLRWSGRGLAAQSRTDQLLFGIIQGGGFADLRRESAERTAALGFGGFAIGGLGVGEAAALRNEMVEASFAPLPEAAPRHLLGIGMPEDLIAGVARGADLFDCVVPTRHARHGSVFTRRGRLHLRNRAGREDSTPLDPDCPCPVCRHFSRAYLRHLVVSKEMLGPRLLTQHNLAYFMSLFREMRDAIAGDQFSEWARSWQATYAEGSSSSATDSAA
jgi:queuine tRNA-ribosyltransferase